MDDSPSKPKKNPGRMLPQRWAKGVSGNPKGRPKGTTLKARILQKEVEARVDAMGIDIESGRILRQHGKQIIQEICRIALTPDIRVVRKGVVVMAPSEAKVKCLIACMDRLVPALKSIELKDDFEHLTPAEMSDEAIISLMQKMVNLATSGVTDELDG